MIRRIRNIKKIKELNNKKKYQSLLENLIILLIKKGIISKKDYENLKKENK